MVFNDKPYYNEPGFEYHSASSDQVEVYNRNVERLTVQHAIVPWLTQRLVSPETQELTPSAPDLSALNESDQSTNGDAQNSKTASSHHHPVNVTPAHDVSQFMPSWAKTVQASQKPASEKPAKEDDPIWGDVIRTHFELKADMILATLRKWERQAVGGATQAPLTAAACKLKQLLGEHGFND